MNDISKVKNDNMQYKYLLEEANELIIVIQDNKIVFVNKKPLLELGYTIDDINNKNFYNYIFVDDREKVMEFQVKKAMNLGLPDDLVFRIITKNNRLIFVYSTSIVTEWKRKPARLICIKNITDKRLNELSLKRNGILLNSIINNLKDPLFILDINGKVILWNKAIEDLSGIKSIDIIGKTDFETGVPFYGYDRSLLINLMLNPYDIDIMNNYSSIKRSEGVLIAGRFLISNNDENAHIWVSSSILYDTLGNIIGAVESFSDMTSLQNTKEKIDASVKENEMLIHEIHHRIKNNLMLIKSMFSIQLQYVKDPESTDLFKDSISRIEAMAIIHNDLYAREFYSDIKSTDFIPKLIYNLRSIYKNQDITISENIEEIQFGIDNAIPFALLFNELLSNSLKHAFKEGQKGEVIIKLFNDKETDLCNLIVFDNGVGLPPDFDYTYYTKSFGMFTVNLLTSQLHGNIKLNQFGGTEFILAFPIKTGKINIIN